MTEQQCIDRTRPACISGNVTRDLLKMTQDPLHEVAMDLAQERLDPAFFNLAIPVKEAEFEVLAEPLLKWLHDEPRWAEEFFDNLQVLAETDAGEELLTTWMDAERFWAMLADGGNSGIMAEISARVEPWRALALDEIYFDFHVLGSEAAAALTRTTEAPADVLVRQP